MSALDHLEVPTPPATRSARHLWSCLALGAISVLSAGCAHLTPSPQLDPAHIAEAPPASAALEFVIEQDKHRSLHTRIDGDQPITLDLTFMDEERASDTCYSIHHAYRPVRGWYSHDDREDERTPLVGTYHNSSLILYVPDDTNSASIGVRCGELIDHSRDDREIGYREKFVLTGTEPGVFSADAKTLTVDPVSELQSDLVETSFFLVTPDNERLDLTAALVPHRVDILKPTSALTHASARRIGDRINLLLIQYNDYSCWNDYTSATQLTLSADTLEVIEEAVYFTDRCGRFYSDIGGPRELQREYREGHIYSVYSDEGGASKQDVIGRFTIEEAQLNILQQWF